MPLFQKTSPLTVAARWPLPTALAASLCVHLGAVAVAGLASSPDAPASKAQRKGSLTVLSLNTTPAPAHHQAAIKQPAPRRDPPRETVRRSEARPSTTKTTPTTTITPPPAPTTEAAASTDSGIHTSASASATASQAAQAPQGAVTPPPAAQPGAAFASLFAPIIQAPMGRGRWQARAPQTPPPPKIDPEQQRIQAMLMLKSALQNRLEPLGAAWRDEPVANDEAPAQCELIIDTTRRVGTVQCSPEARQDQVWAMLQGLVRHEETTPGETSLVCATISTGAPSWHACPSLAGL